MNDLVRQLRLTLQLRFVHGFVCGSIRERQTTDGTGWWSVRAVRRGVPFVVRATSVVTGHGHGGHAHGTAVLAVRGRRRPGRRDSEAERYCERPSSTRAGQISDPWRGRRSCSDCLSIVQYVIQFTGRCKVQCRSDYSLQRSAAGPEC